MQEYPLNERKSINALLYICRTLGGAWDKYSLLKILYFAEKKHLVKYGRSITGDRMVAMKFGPVPSFSYDKVKERVYRGETIFDHEEYVVIALCEPEMDYLSDSEIECLNESILENSKLNFAQLRDKSHDPAYEIAWQRGRNTELSYLDMARAEGAKEEMIAYICDQIEVGDW